MSANEKKSYTAPQLTKRGELPVITGQGGGERNDFVLGISVLSVVDITITTPAPAS
jgi:hypothetical protein